MDQSFISQHVGASLPVTEGGAPCRASVVAVVSTLVWVGPRGDCTGDGYGASPVTLRGGGPLCPCTSGPDGTRRACIGAMHPGASLSSGLLAFWGSMVPN